MRVGMAATAREWLCERVGAAKEELMAEASVGWWDIENSPTITQNAGNERVQAAAELLKESAQAVDRRGGFSRDDQSRHSSNFATGRIVLGQLNEAELCQLVQRHDTRQLILESSGLSGGLLNVDSRPGADEAAYEYLERMFAEVRHDRRHRHEPRRNAGVSYLDSYLRRICEDARASLANHPLDALETATRLQINLIGTMPAEEQGPAIVDAVASWIRIPRDFTENGGYFDKAIVAATEHNRALTTHLATTISPDVLARVLLDPAAAEPLNFAFGTTEVKPGTRLTGNDLAVYTATLGPSSDGASPVTAGVPVARRVPLQYPDRADCDPTTIALAATGATISSPSIAKKPT